MEQPRAAREDCVLDVDEAGLSAVSPKLGKTAVPGCAPLGGAARFMHISPTHVGMVRSGPRNLLPTHVGMDLVPERCRENLQRLPHACGDPRLGGFVSVPGSRE